MEKGILTQGSGSGNKAESGDHLESVFLSNISHEIRTPLNAIVGFSTLLSGNLENGERRKEYLDIILRSSDHLLQVIDDIVEISKIEARTVIVTREKVNINSILRRVNDQFVPEAALKCLQLNVSYGLNENEAEIATDGFKLTQILKNLVGNALKFTCEGKVEFGCLLKEGIIEFYVSDTGEGIAEEQKDHVFNRFFQVYSGPSRCYGGLGLGLAISKAYAGLLGGEIRFTSKPGEGSEFRFMIPAEKTGNGEITVTKDTNQHVQRQI